jgi:hypothetical protein
MILISCVFSPDQNIFPLSLIFRSLHDVNKTNAYRAVCPSVHIFLLENRWTDGYDICYGGYSIGSYSKSVLF